LDGAPRTLGAVRRALKVRGGVELGYLLGRRLAQKMEDLATFLVVTRHLVFGHTPHSGSRYKRRPVRVVPRPLASPPTPSCPGDQPPQISRLAIAGDSRSNTCGRRALTHKSEAPMTHHWFEDLKFSV